MKIKHTLGMGLFFTVLAGFTLYVALDAFVIPRAYTAVAASTAETGTLTTDSESTSSSSRSGKGRHHKSRSSADSTESETQSAVTTETEAYDTSGAVTTENSYEDENISITITEYFEYDTAIYVADVTVSSPEYLKTALANDIYGRNITQTTSDMAESKGAILAVNGDYYGAQTKGYVIRNGVLYRDTSAGNQEDLVIMQDGSFRIINESSVSASDLLNEGAQQLLSFGPALITDGTISVDQDDEVGQAMASNPRTAIGIIDDCHYVFVVSDGRTDESEGLDLYELAEFMETLGVETAYNLDGGGSSTMYFNGQIINNPTTNGNSESERSVSDIVYIG